MEAIEKKLGEFERMDLSQYNARYFDEQIFDYIYKNVDHIKKKDSYIQKVCNICQKVIKELPYTSENSVNYNNKISCFNRVFYFYYQFNEKNNIIELYNSLSIEEKNRVLSNFSLMPEVLLDLYYNKIKTKKDNEDRMMCVEKYAELYECILNNGYREESIASIYNNFYKRYKKYLKKEEKRRRKKEKRRRKKY